MAVRIRMKRLGRKHRPFYRIAVMDSQRARDSKSIEDVGTYDPMVSDKSARVNLNMERIDYWMSVGAKPSDKVAVLIKKVKANDFGEAKAPPPLTPPKAPPEPEPEAPAEAAEGEATESAEAEGGEEAPAEEAAE
ncbi:MAG: 30S ribosomal protein S16 [Planctomycetaceae bacterium]|nr:30S ribosomal protein S16 [Planctomycetaceae bacterium]